jgi:hypothetical protein
MSMKSSGERGGAGAGRGGMREGSSRDRRVMRGWTRGNGGVEAEGAWAANMAG